MSTTRGKRAVGRSPSHKTGSEILQGNPWSLRHHATGKQHPYVANPEDSIPPYPAVISELPPPLGVPASRKQIKQPPTHPSHPKVIAEPSLAVPAVGCPCSATLPTVKRYGERLRK